MSGYDDTVQYISLYIVSVVQKSIKLDTDSLGSVLQHVCIWTGLLALTDPVIRVNSHQSG